MLKIARVIKSNGADGEVLISFSSVDPQEIDAKVPVFIEFDGLPVPFFIESYVPRGTSRALVHLTGVWSLEDADELAGKDIWCREEDLPGAEEGEGLDPDALIGWKLLDADGACKGEVCGSVPIPGNPCLEISTENGQAIIPLHEDLILSVDFKGKTLQMSLPDGLL